MLSFSYLVVLVSGYSKQPDSVFGVDGVRQIYLQVSTKGKEHSLYIHGS